MAPEFFETRMGKTFYEGTMPRIAAELHELNAHLGKVLALPKSLFTQVPTAPPAAEPVDSDHELHLLDFVAKVSRLTKDGECVTHGETCTGDQADCKLFDLPSDDAVETLHMVISEARRLRAEGQG
jgi:hypothetical protein